MNNLLKQDVSKTAYGRRTVFKQLVCFPEDSIFYGKEKEQSFWLTDASGTESITAGPDYVQMTGYTDYRKWFDVHPQTWYYLLFEGKVDTANYADYFFGLVDQDGKRLENRLTISEKGYYITAAALDDEITILGQDGNWYPRIYKFFTGDNSRLAFYAQGSEGAVFLRNMQVCLAKDIHTCIENDESNVQYWIEDESCCDAQHNLAASALTDWESPYGYGLFIQKNGGRLTYTDSGRGCYYLVWLPVEEERVYTGSFWYRVKKAGEARFGFIWENKDGKRSSRALMSADVKGDWKKSSISFTLAKGARMAFAVYDGGGEVEFDRIRAFLNGFGFVCDEDNPIS